MKKIVLETLTLTVLFLIVACVSGPVVQTEQDNISGFVDDTPKPRIAILPFSGGREGEGDIIASLFSNQPALREVFTLVIRTESALNAIFSENNIQLSSLTDNNSDDDDNGDENDNNDDADADEITGLRRLLNAEFVLSGSINRLGNKNILIASLINVTTFEQVAGDFQTYSDIGEVTGLLPVMSKNMIDTALGRDTEKREYLSIIPFTSRTGISPADIHTLTEIIALELVKTGKYAVLPRNAAIQKAMTEQTVQRQAANAGIVLNGEIGVLGSSNIFSAQLLRTDGSLIIGDNINYRDITEGINLMPELAIRLTELNPEIAQRKIAEHQRNVKMKQEAEIAAIAEARRAQEAEAAKERMEREAEAKRIQKEREAEARKIKRKNAWEDTIDNAHRNEWETVSFSYLWEGSDPNGEDVYSGFSFNLVLCGFYWSFLPFTNVGIQSGVTAFNAGNYFNSETGPDFKWYFNISPTIGALYPLSENARIFANAVFEFGSLPWQGLMAHKSITDDFNIGLTPGFNTGLSLGKISTFTFNYRLVWYKNAFSNSIGISFGKIL